MTLQSKPSSQKLERLVASTLILCVTLVIAWEIAAKVASRPFDELRLNSSSFSGFTPKSPQWSIRLLGVQSTPTEPTVIAYRVQHDLSSLPSVQNAPLLIRIVHGYNMVDCMRIKQYKVTLLADTRDQRSEVRGQRSEAGERRAETFEPKNHTSQPRTQPPSRPPVPISAFNFPNFQFISMPCEVGWGA